MIKFRIKGILTHYCQEAIVHNLKNVKGIEEAYLDFLSGQGTLLAKEEIDRKFVTEVIDIMGYTIEWIK
jgi:hypothetical protein